MKKIFSALVWILLKYHPYHLFGPVIKTFFQKSPYLFSGIMLPKKDGAIGQQQKAYSVLTSREIVDIKFFSEPSGISFVKT